MCMCIIIHIMCISIHTQTNAHAHTNECKMMPKPTCLFVCIHIKKPINYILQIDQKEISIGEARAIWDVGHYGKSLYLQNSESSNCICVFH